MRKLKQTGQKEIGRIRLSDNQELVVSIGGNQKLDLRVWISGKSYTGSTRQGVRLYLFDDSWTEFRKVIDEVDKVYEEIA